MEVVDSTIKSALKTWQTSSTGRTRESPLWSHDPWTHRSREAAGRPEKNDFFKAFRESSHSELSQRRVEVLGKGTFKARPRLGLQEPTSRELTVFVTRTFAGDIVMVFSYWRVFGRHFLESQFFLRFSPLPPPSSKRYNCCTGPQISTIPGYKCDRWYSYS